MARNDGKYLEKNVQEVYGSLKNPDVVMERQSDSTSARRIGKATVADFLIANVHYGCYWLECKSVKHHFRLPKFVQHARINRWAMAGVPGYLLVHHWETDVYRIVPVKDLRIGAASFDLRSYEELAAKEALQTVFWL